MKKRACLCVVFSILLMFSGCSHFIKDTDIGYDIPVGADNFDPQYVSDNVAQMVVYNLFEGLVVLDTEGKIHPGAATNWQISPDGLEYRFTLREKMYWPSETTTGKGDPLTAENFRFGLERLFNPDAPSPHVGNFSAIANGEKILNNEEPLSALGVSAPDDHTLVIRLDNPDPLFLHQLATSPAMPCNERFFRECKGRYGLGRKMILGNGPFEMTRFEEDSRITLKPNSQYKGENSVAVNSVNLYIGRPDPAGRFHDGNTDILKIEASEVGDLKNEDSIIVNFDDIVWCVAFQTAESHWAVPYLRTALAETADRSAMNQLIGGNFEATDSIMSDQIRIGSYFYEDLAVAQKLSQGNPTQGIAMYKEGLSVLDMGRIPSASLYIPATGPHEDYLRPIQAGWKNALSLYVSVNSLQEQEFQQALKTGDFDMILLPLRSSSIAPEGVLNQFTIGNPKNVLGYQSEAFDAIVEHIYDQETIEQMGEKARQGENMLLSDAVVIPLYTEKSYYAVTKTAEDVDIYPYEGIIRFHPVT